MADTPGDRCAEPPQDAYRGAVPRSPLNLAALATVAIPGLDAFDVRQPPVQAAGVDATIVVDAEGRRWVVQAPQNAAAGAALEAEVALLGALIQHVDAGRLPFDVPRPAGFASLPEGGRAVVSPQLPGRPLQLERLGPGPGLAAALGRAVAALHELPAATVEDAGLPVYEAEAYRRRRLSEVDEAARTGKVPARLLRRWERALEDVAMWRFQPTVVHGDLSAEHVLCSATAPTGILGWSEAKVADPADDLAWLLVAAPQEAVDPILEAYSLRRTELADRHLAARALLAGELALARWLLHGVRADDTAIIDDATAMLVELDEHTAEPEGGAGGSPFGSAAAGSPGAGATGAGSADRVEAPAEVDREEHEAYEASEGSGEAVVDDAVVDDAVADSAALGGQPLDRSDTPHQDESDDVDASDPTGALVGDHSGGPDEATDHDRGDDGHGARR